MSVQFLPIIRNSDGLHQQVLWFGKEVGSIHKWEGGLDEWDLDASLEEYNQRLDYGEQADIYGQAQLRALQREIRAMFRMCEKPRETRT